MNTTNEYGIWNTKDELDGKNKQKKMSGANLNFKLKSLEIETATRI